MSGKNPKKEWYKERLKNYYRRLQQARDPKLENLLDGVLDELERRYSKNTALAKPVTYH